MAPEQYVCSLRLSISLPIVTDTSATALQVQACAIAFLTARCVLSDYIEASMRITMELGAKTDIIKNYSNMVVVGARRHLHDVRKGDSRDRPAKIILKRTHDGKTKFDLDKVKHLPRLGNSQKPCMHNLKEVWQKTINIVATAPISDNFALLQGNHGSSQHRSHGSRSHDSRSQPGPEVTSRLNCSRRVFGTRP